MTKSKGIQQPKFDQPVFAYGSLRVGQPLYKSLAFVRREKGQRPVATDERCVVQGFTLWDVTRGLFPHAVESELPGARVVGDVLWLSKQEYEYIRWVETEAGYGEMLVEVTDGAGVKIKAQIFYASTRKLMRMADRPAELVGEDWLAYEGRWNNPARLKAVEERKRARS